ncbi:MAG: hypothetical protein ABJH04_19470 [Cyclobacteriaceae bacterium]
MGLKLGYQVGLKESYPEDKPAHLGDLLVGIPRDTILLVVSSLLNKREVYDSDLAKMISIWFRAENKQFANDAYSRLIKIQEKVQQPVFFISQPTVLKIFAYALNNLSNEKSVSDEQMEINLFKAFLYQNDLLNLVEKEISRTIQDLDIDVRLYALQFSDGVRFSDVVNFNLYEVFLTEFVRAILFFEFLDNRNEARPLLKAFYKNYNVSDWKEYLKRISGISFSILKKPNDGHLELEITKDASFESNIKFLNKLAAVKYDELSDYDFKVVRERPLQKIEEGKYRIISEIFTVERIFKGLYFILKGINESLSAAEQIPDLKQLYTFQFSEKNSLYSILNRAFPKKYITFSGEELDNLKIKGAPDYYVRNKNKIFIFESKDSLISASLKESGDFSLLEADLKRKFYSDRSSPKAINQLINFSQKIINGEFQTIDKGYKKENIRVYPIIIIHDRQLDVPGFNKLINHWYNDEIKKQGLESPFIKVKQIVVLDMATLILIHELLKDRRIILETLIDNFLEYVKIQNTKNFSSHAKYENHIMDTGLPFSYFIKEQTIKKRLPRSPNRFIEEKAIIALD